MGNAQNTMTLASCMKSFSDTIAWLRRGRRISTNGRPVKLNLGSSLVVHEGWINIDATHHILFRKLPKPVLTILYRHSQIPQFLSEEQYLSRLTECEFVHHSLIYGIPLADGTAEFVYTSHFLEHLYEEQANALLRESFRVLKPGGRIRVCIPDLKHAVECYLEGRKRDALGYFFQPANVHTYERHRFMYDFELLAAMLKNSGFRDMEECKYQEGQVPDLAKLDNRSDETLYVEAAK